MRSFNKMMVLVCLTAAFTFGCTPADDSNCGMTGGCPMPENCGDDACQASEGENAQNCPMDCIASTCGDGTCSAADGETSSNCEADCNVTCLQADKPVYCADTNSCWPANTDCQLPSYECGGQVGRCTEGQAANYDDSQVSCCGGVYHDCPIERPQWCPESSACVLDGACPSAATDCELPRLDCQAP